MFLLERASQSPLRYHKRYFKMNNSTIIEKNIFGQYGSFAYVIYLERKFIFKNQFFFNH